MRVLSALFVIVTPLGPINAQGNIGYQPADYNDGKFHYETNEQRFEGFTVVRYIEDCRAVPMLDQGCWLTKNARLTWMDSTKTIGFTFTDDGVGVSFSSNSKSTDKKSSCIEQSVLIGYDPKPSTAENIQKLLPFIERSIRACPEIASADLKRAMIELKSSGESYATAANAWKGVAQELFGPKQTRCVADRQVDQGPGRLPRYVCTRFSDGSQPPKY
ncbi:hypothetical protein [Sphingomonas sp. UYP23]